MGKWPTLDPPKLVGFQLEHGLFFMRPRQGLIFGNFFICASARLVFHCDRVSIGQNPQILPPLCTLWSSTLTARSRGFLEIFSGIKIEGIDIFFNSRI